MSVTEPGLQRLRMSWEDYLALPEKPKAEWVDGEVVVSPPVSFEHGAAAVALGSALRDAMPHLLVVTEVGLHLAGNRLRAPDLMVTQARPAGAWVEDPPVLVVEVLSASTRSEDTGRKSSEYAAGGVGQFWVVDPVDRAIDVYENADGGWQLLLHLDESIPVGEVVVADHGVVALDLRVVLPGPAVGPGAPVDQ